MTANENRTETLIEQALARRAGHAPPDDLLLTRVHSRLRRRRTGRRLGAALVAGTAVAAGIVGVNVLTGNETGRPSDQAGVAGRPVDQPVTAPDGWRWESYRTVQLLVPDTWGHGTTDSPACLVDKVRPPYVGRPGPIPMIACTDDVVKPAYRSSYLWFGGRARTDAQARDHGWVQETRVVAGVPVTVFSNDAALRGRILGSLRTIGETDAHGCAVSRPQWARPGGRPTGEGLGAVGSVKSITVCTYDREGKLFAGSSIDGTAMTALLGAPEGSGPNPGCSEKYGSMVVTLKVHGDRQAQDVLLRYDGCDHNGIDDGSTMRKLTRETVGPILTGPHRPTSHHGGLTEILPPW
jgi:hypothetical protein